MLTLEDTECKDFSKIAMENEETNEKRSNGESYEKGKYPIVNGEILRSALLSPEDDDEDNDDDDNNDDDGDDNDIESEEDNVSSELLSIENDSEVSSESTVSDLDDLGTDSPLSYVTSVPNNKEFIIITQLESNNALRTKKLNNQCSLPDKKSKSPHRSKRRNKVLLLRKLIPKHEPIVEIKEEEHSIISTDVDDRVPTMEEIDYEESSVDQQSILDSNVDWLQNFRPLPLYYTERGKPYLKCPACGAMFFTSNSFQKHLYSHMYKEDDTFICSFCNYTNTEPGMLFTHLSKHQDQCEFCNENLMRKNNFEKHWDIRASSFTIKRDHQGRFVCIHCKLVFDLLPQLEKHWFKHACRRERTYQCQECSGLYESIETLNNHKCMKCPVCGKIYDSLHGLKAHTMWTKHNLKCPICSYEFILTLDHEKHLALHRQTYRSMKDYEHCLQAADGKTVQCNLCDKIFHALPSLVLHLREDHGIKNVKKEVLKDNGNGDQQKESVSEIILRELKKATANYSSGNNSTVLANKIEL